MQMENCSNTTLDRLSKRLAKIAQEGMHELISDLAPSPLQAHNLDSGINAVASQVEQTFRLAFETSVRPEMRRCQSNSVAGQSNDVPQMYDEYFPAAKSIGNRVSGNGSASSFLHGNSSNGFVFDLYLTDADVDHRQCFASGDPPVRNSSTNTIVNLQQLQQAQELQSLRHQLRQQEQDQVLSSHLQRCLDLAGRSSSLLSADCNSFDLCFSSGSNSFDGTQLMSSDGFDSGSLSGLLPLNNTMPPQQSSAQQAAAEFQLDQQMQQIQVQQAQNQSSSLMSQLMLAAESMGHKQQQQWQRQKSFAQLQQGLPSATAATVSSSWSNAASSPPPCMPGLIGHSFSSGSLMAVQQQDMDNSCMPMRSEPLPPRFASLPPSVQLRVVQMVQANPVVTLKDFDEKVVGKMAMLAESYGTDECLTMLSHLEHRMRTKMVAMKNGPGYLDVAVSSHLDVLKARGMCPQGSSIQEYAQHTLGSSLFEELRVAVEANRWLQWEHLDQGIVQLIKKLPREAGMEKLHELASHSFKNADNMKGCIMSVLNAKPRGKPFRQF